MTTDHADIARKMWRECFPAVKRQWVDLYMQYMFNPLYFHHTTDAEGHPVSSLMLEPRMMTFHGSEEMASYLCFACTAPRYRGLGSMRSLLAEALRMCHDVGDMTVWLIPAAEWLRSYYERAGGWATVVYSREDCYTAIHQFDMGQYLPAPTQGNTDALYEAFSRFERTSGGCVVLHSRTDFDMLVADCRMDGGDIIGVCGPGGDIAAVAVGVPDDFGNVVTVKMAAGENAAAVDAALEVMRLHYPGKSLRVMRPASDNYSGGGVHRLVPSGMARIVNAGECLDLIARNAPTGWSKAVKVRDSIIAANAHTYILHGGEGAEIDDSVRPSTLNGFDVDVSVLARMVYGSRPIADIIDFPGVRPVMNLMLE